MAYNNLSGTVFLPDKLTTRLNLASGSIISGNLDYSDGSNITNIPRLSNATNNALVTNVGGDANSLTCESNLTFDGNILRINAGIEHVRKFVNENYTITTSDFFIGADSSNGVLQITLPAASSTSSGQTFVIKDEGGAAANNNITVVAPGSDTIDGINSVVLKSPFVSIQLYCNGTNKYFIY